MATLPIQDAINRLVENEERADKWVNDPDGYTTTGADFVESIPHFMARKEVEAEADLAGAVATATSDALDYALQAQGARDAAFGARDQAIQITQTTGVISVYKTYADANAALGSIAANAFIEVLVDESRSGTPRTRYQKVGGSLVFVLDLDRYTKQMLTDPKAYVLGPFFDQVKTKACRILLLGTSIASFDISPTQGIPEQAANIHGRNLSKIFNLGVYGGNYAPYDGHAKQVFGGASYYRLVMKPGENDINLNGVCDKVIVVYGKESGGGSFDVYVDGTYNTTVSSSGSQSYNNEAVINFTTKEYRKVTLKAPSSGKAYIERVEFIQTDPGIYIEDGTLGGTGLRHSITLQTDSTPGNEAGITISGYNGVDSIFGRTGETKPDLIVMQHMTNDGGAGLTDFLTALNRAVLLTKANATPMVANTEMPALSYVQADGSLLPNSSGGARETRAALIALKQQKHIEVLDWTEMVDYSDKTAYEAKYFPGVDKTHPTDEGHLPLTAAMADLFCVPNHGRKFSLDINQQYFRDLMGSASLQAADDPYNARGYRTGLIKPQKVDDLHDQFVTIVGKATTLDNTLVDLVAATKLPNVAAKQIATDIAASGTADKYGKYLRLTSNTTVGNVGSFQPASIEQIFTLVLQVKSVNGGGSVRMFNSSNNKNVRWYVLNKPYEGLNVNFPETQLPRDVPTFVAVQYKLDATDAVGSQLSLIGSGIDVYGVWVTEGTQAIITPRYLDSYRGVGLPVVMDGDFTLDKVTVGQAYHEPVNGAIVEKVALDGYCWRADDARFSRIYDQRNTTGKFFQRLPVISPGTLGSFNERLGGKLYASSGGFGAGAAIGISSFPIAGFPYSKTLTLAFQPNGDSRFRIAFYNGATNTFVYLKSDGSWGTTSSFGSIPVLGVNNGAAAIAACSYTFTAPAAGFATDLGASPAIYVQPQGNSGAGYIGGVLCEGSSACVTGLL